MLWRIRRIFQEFPRDYAIAVYDDGSTDATADTLKAYTEVLPLTVLGDGQHRGYAAAVDGRRQSELARPMARGVWGPAARQS